MRESIMRLVPELLLGPLLDAAAGVVRAADPADLPGELRSLQGFRASGLQRGAARQRLARALEDEEGFRKVVIDVFNDRAEVRAALAGWSPDEATARVGQAAERGDLPLLVSALLAARPIGWAFGVGLACATYQVDRRADEDEAERLALSRRAEATEESARRAEAARAQAVADAQRWERELRDERASRRMRDDRAQRAVDAAERRVAELVEQGERLQRELDTVRARVRRAEEQARDAQTAARDAQAAARGARAAATGPTVALGDEDLQTLADAAELARRLADGLGGVAEKVHDLRARAPKPTSTKDGSKGDVSTKPAAKPRARRTAVRIPPGMALDAPGAVDPMLRTPGLAVLVDGYNVTMQAWPALGPAEQRDRLVSALAAVHARTRAEITVVFDGANVAPLGGERRPGVRVRFSAPGEEADAVIVAEAAALPLTVPVLVVSSDGWVREHAARAGAAVLHSSTFLQALRA